MKLVVAFRNSTKAHKKVLRNYGPSQRQIILLYCRHPDHPKKVPEKFKIESERRLKWWCANGGRLWYISWKEGQTCHKSNGSQNEYINDISMHFVSLAEHKAADSFRNRRRAKNNRFSPRYCDHTLTESREKEKEHCATVGCVSSNLNKLLHV
jgi:hypothetical protein